MKKDKELFWNRKIEQKIKVWTGHLSKLKKVTKATHCLSDIDDITMKRKYNIHTVGYIHVISHLKVKIHNGSLTISNQKNKAEQFQQNKLFMPNHSQFYKELDGITTKKNVSPEPKAVTNLWNFVES